MAHPVTVLGNFIQFFRAELAFIQLNIYIIFSISFPIIIMENITEGASTHKSEWEHTKLPVDSKRVGN